VNWFNRGKEAFGRGEPAEKIAGRLTNANSRAAFHAGYSEASGMARRLKTSPEELEENRKRFVALRQHLKGGAA
jgi:hypothetical protein